MHTNKLKFVKTSEAALVVAPPKGGVELAAFTAKTGEHVVSNAGMKPHSPFDGTVMQLASSQRVTLTAAQLAKAFVDVGTCGTCRSKLMASASAADSIEMAGSGFHCPMCASSVTATVDNQQLIAALASEFDYDDDDADAGDDDAGDEDDDDDDADADSDDGEDADNADDEDFGDEDGEDEDSDDDFGDDEDKDDETAAVRARLSRRRARVAARASDDADCGDGDDAMTKITVGDADRDGVPDVDDDEFTAAVASVRAEMTRLGMAVADEDSDAEDDDDSETDKEREDAEREDEDDGEDRGERVRDEDDEEVAAAAKALRAHIAAFPSGVQPTAGRRSDNASVDAMNDAARASLRDRRAGRPDGNQHIKGVLARASDMGDADDMRTITDADADDVPGLNMDGVTPGNGDNVKAEDDKQEGTPGSGVDVKGEDEGHEQTPGTADDDHDTVAVSALAAFDWTRTVPEVVSVAATPDVKWVFADGRPVGTLSKASASPTVVAQWDQPTLARALQSAASRGMQKAEVAEFGLRAHTYRMEGSEVVRNAMKRHSQLAVAQAADEVARGRARYQQGVKTAVIAALKGTFPDLKNPLRDALVAKLSSLSVAQPHGVVDQAFASNVEAFLTGVFAKAEEIADKTDAARNEVASLVATSSYQTRVSDTGAELSARLSAGGPRALVPTAAVAGADASPAPTQDSLIRSAIRSIRR